MNQEIFDWLLLLVRWLHITVAVTWIGTSIFFMWLDRTFKINPEATRPGHVGDLWMLHGGNFYHVEKLLMGPTKVPDHLHWFKWESYWTWMSGMMLLTLTYYMGDGTFLLDSMVSDITYGQGLSIAVFSVIGSWFFYDFVWERKAIRQTPLIGHLLTLSWFAGMSYFLCHTLSGRAAYIHIGGMLGTWMTANVFQRIIPRQLLMVEAAKKGEPVNQEWGKNAKNRSTHNTYFTLPVIFIMLSNHFPQTYGHEYNWLILLLISAGGAAIREYFVVRLQNPKRSKMGALLGVALIVGVIVFSREKKEQAAVVIETVKEVPVQATVTNLVTVDVKGVVKFEGTPPVGKKLSLPAGCKQEHQGDVYSNEVIVKNGFLQNVLVRVIKGHEGQSYNDVPSEEIVLDQKGCMYTPRVAASRVGQKVTFVNSDPIFHNVRSVTNLNQRFNMAMPKLNQRETKIFTKAEVFLQAKCSVHPWMGAYLAVMEHPFFAISSDDGTFTLPKLPIGKYTIEAWHEVFGTQTQDIEVIEGINSELLFTFKDKGSL